MAGIGANGEMKAHEATYSRFISFTKIGTVVTIGVTALVIFLIA